MPGEPTIILKSEHSWLCITDTEAIILKLACIRELNCSLSKAVGLGKGDYTSVVRVSFVK